MYYANTDFQILYDKSWDSAHLGNFATWLQTIGPAPCAAVRGPRPDFGSVGGSRRWCVRRL